MLLNLRLATLATAAAFLHLLPISVIAQTAPTAQQRIRVDVYGLLSYVRPDFRDSSNTFGVTAGGNLDAVRVLPYTDLGLDLRGALSRADAINELSLSGGPRVSYNRYRLRPYAEYMFGIGRGGFNNAPDPDYQRDYTAIRSYGGGFDYRVSRDFSLRADVQRQRWRFTYTAPYFHPINVSIGLSYRLHLHTRTGPQ